MLFSVEFCERAFKFKLFSKKVINIIDISNVQNAFLSLKYIFGVSGKRKPQNRIFRFGIYSARPCGCRKNIHGGVILTNRSEQRKNRVKMEQIKEKFIEAKRALFDRAYGARLNPEQRCAVFTVNGPLLVLAGAGSGKTTVLVNRIAYIIKYGNAYFSEQIPDGVSDGMAEALFALAKDGTDEDVAAILPEFICEPCPPWSVLAITFTNKAAKEIKDRLLTVFPDGEFSESVWAGTFHSICVRILRKYGTRVGYREAFSIYDKDDKKRLVSICMKELGIDEKLLAAKAVENAISRAKDSLIGPEDFEIGRDPRGKDILEIYKLYQKKLLEYNAMDFDDIIMKTVELLRSDAEVRTYYQRKFRYVLVDEYQDTNYAQFVLTSILSEGYRNIMVVGDDDQSIYRFRGATVENILNFDKTYPEATVIKLEQNYRSTENILNAANAIISHNSNRHSKHLWSERGAGDRIILHEAPDQNDEGKFIVDSIIGGIYKEKRRYSDYAVLYRVNALGRSLQTSFTKSGIPFKVVGDMGFYDHKEVKDMIAYLSVISSSSDDLRLKRIINEPKRKIGAATVETVEIIASELGRSMYDIISHAGEYIALGKSADKLTAFAHMIESVRECSTLPSEYIKNVYELSGYKDMLAAEGFEGEGKAEYVNELISAALEYEARCAAAQDEPTLSAFLEELSLVSDIDKYDDDENAVVLMTVHAAKGLEFPVVFIAGMEDGIFPAQQNFGNEEEMSEERRLAYVAITRAKEKLYITYAKNRMMYGKTSVGGVLSCFVRDEVPRELIEIDRPRQIPPRVRTDPYAHKTAVSRERSIGGELGRSPDITRTFVKKQGAESFGVKKLCVGARVRHSIFGEGTVTSVKDMGGDVLYGVKFDSGEEKRLMSTFAKLVEIGVEK